MLYTDKDGKLPLNFFRMQRFKCGMSMDTAAKELGVTKQSISNWERGANKPSLYNIWRMSQVYGFDIDDAVKSYD